MRKAQFTHHSPWTRNVGKFFSYAEAWTRIRRAQEEGFFLEAVTLEEAVISDRLFGYLVAFRVIPAVTESHAFPSFNALIQHWRKQNPTPIPTAKTSDLQTAVDEWRKERNRVVHGMVKSNPGHPTEPIEDFLAKAKVIASEGATLARSVAKWCDKARRSLSRIPINEDADRA